MLTVDRHDLGPLALLGEGKFGSVYKAQPMRSSGAPMAYKELKALSKQEEKAALDWNRRAIAESIEFRELLTSAERADLDSFAVWPQVLVKDRGRVTGYLMNLIDDSFFLPTSGGRELATMSWLSAKDSTCRAAGIDRTPFDAIHIRQFLLRQLAFSIAWLHRRGRIYGDLSLSNGLFVATPPRFLLMDCDATARVSDRHRIQANTPYFSPPESGRSSLQTRASDVYKLGLCIVRGLTKGRGATQTKDPRQLQGILPDSIIALVSQALDKDPGKRPSAKELWRAFDAHVSVAYAPPHFTGLSLDRHRVVRGEDVMIDWICPTARRINVTGPDGKLYKIRDPSGRLAVRAGCSGDIRISAENTFGVTEAVIGFVSVYEIPPVEIPLLTIPPTPLVSLPTVVPPAQAPVPKLPLLPTPEIPSVDAIADTGDSSLIAARVAETSNQLMSSLGQTISGHVDTISHTIQLEAEAARNAASAAPTAVAPHSHKDTNVSQ